jgi:hypothetical protein
VKRVTSMMTAIRRAAGKLIATKLPIAALAPAKQWHCVVIVGRPANVREIQPGPSSISLTGE